MRYINRFIIGCVLLLALIGCQDKAAMEIQGMMSFCKNMAIYGEQDDLADNIILAEAEALGFNVEGERVQSAFKVSHLMGQMGISKLNAANAMADMGMGAARSGKPTGLYVAGCLKTLKDYSDQGSVTMP